MPVTLDYSSAFHNQYEFAETNRKKINRVSHLANGLLGSFFSVHTLLKKVNELFTAQLLYSKGLLSQANEHLEEIKKQDSSKLISQIELVINKNIEIQSSTEAIIKKDTNSKYPEFQITNALLIETIENLYGILRILKRFNKKTPIARTELAEISAAHSAKALEKVFYGR